MKKIINWKSFFILLTACVIASVLVMPYQLALAPNIAEKLGAMIYPVAVIQGLVYFSIASFFGLLLAKKAGFSLPVLEGENRWESLKSIIKPSLFWGVISGVLIILLDLPFSDITASMQTEAAPVWTGFLASFYGGIAEETLFRLCLMSLLVWLAIKVKIPRNAAIWVVIILISVVFGLGHLPFTGQLTDITAKVLLRAVLLNSAGSIIFSLMYWKKGLESAMIAHFSADIVLHVIAPLAALLFI